MAATLWTWFHPNRISKRKIVVKKPKGTLSRYRVGIMGRENAHNNAGGEEIWGKGVG